MKKGMDAVTFRRILISTLFLMTVLAGFGYQAINSALGKAAQAANQEKIKAATSRNDVEQLQRLETYMKDNQQTMQRASEIVADTKQYQYQDQIVRDISTYAARSGVSVLGFNFNNDPAATSGRQTTDTPNISGLKTMPIVITLQNPVPYENFLRFLKSIEQNLTKMQVNGVTLSPDPANYSQVTNPTIGVEVYVR